MPVEPITLDECRPQVRQFALQMERKLRQNDHKPGWENDSFDELFARMLEEAGEVLIARITGDDPAGEIADVANFAMMIWDNLTRQIDEHPTASV